MFGGEGVLKYQAIAQEINQYIKDKHLSQGDKLPSLKELVVLFEASRSTLVKALALLESHGKIYQVRGSGIYVRSDHKAGYINLLEAQGLKLDSQTFDDLSTVVSLEEVTPSPSVRAALKIPAGQKVYYVSRVRYIDGQAYCYEESYYNKAYVTYLNEQIVSESIFTYIEEGLQLKIGFADIVVKLDHLNQTQARHLKAEEGQACFLLESIHHLHNGAPFDYSLIRYRQEDVAFYLQTQF